MHSVSVETCLVWLIVALTLVNCGRKYDLEEEAIKLYHDDLKTVLRRFRRTPEYLKILQDRIAELHQYVDDMAMQTMFHYQRQLAGKVQHMLGLNMKNNTITRRNLFKRAFHRRYDDGDADIGDAGSEGDAAPRQREGAEQRDANATLAAMLDGYEKLKSSLTLKQRNALKDLGYQYAGEVIHSVVRSLGAAQNGPEQFSTKAVQKNEDFSESTTQHVSVHEVTISNSTSLTTSMETETGTNVARRRARARRLKQTTPLSNKQ